jgi:hypothetical protein
MALEFDQAGALAVSPPPLVEIPLPILFDILPWSPPGKGINLTFLEGATSIGTFTVIRQSEFNPEMETYLPHIVLFADRNISDIDPSIIRKLRMVEIPYGENVIALQNTLKEKNPALVVLIRMDLGPDSSEHVVRLTRDGAEAIHLIADEYGLENAERPLFVKERLKEIHLKLVDRGLRDQITLIAGGGIAMAEHVAKLIICGADLLSMDIPLLIAMECRVCRRCKEGITCPVELDRVNPAWGAGRIRNLLAGWHNQLIEILGAMGIREIRRLRGEMGRAMFYDDLEKDLFAVLGKRK